MNSDSMLAGGFQEIRELSLDDETDELVESSIESSSVSESTFKKADETMNSLALKNKKSESSPQAFTPTIMKMSSNTPVHKDKIESFNNQWKKL